MRHGQLFAGYYIVFSKAPEPKGARIMCINRSGGTSEEGSGGSGGTDEGIGRTGSTSDEEAVYEALLLGTSKAPTDFAVWQYLQFLASFPVATSL